MRWYSLIRSSRRDWLDAGNGVKTDGALYFETNQPIYCGQQRKPSTKESVKKWGITETEKSCPCPYGGSTGATDVESHFFRPLRWFQTGFHRFPGH